MGARTAGGILFFFALLSAFAMAAQPATGAGGFAQDRLLPFSAARVSLPEDAPLSPLVTSQAAAQQGAPTPAPEPLPGADAQQTSVVTAPAVVEPPSPNASAAELEHSGDLLRLQRRFLDAIDYYQAALKKTPKPATASLWNKIGIAKLQMVRVKDARKAFDKAVKIDKTRPEYFNNRGAAEYALKRYRNAISDYRRALKMNDQSASFHSNLANALFASKQIPEAVAEFLRAVQLDPLILDRHAQGGVVAQMTNSQDRAEYAYILARIYARAGDFDRALEQLRHAMEDGYKNIKDVNKDADFAVLRKDPRFAALMASKPLAIPQ